VGLGVNPGAYAESVTVHHSMLIRLPDELPLEHGALVEPLAVTVHGLRQVGLSAGERARGAVAASDALIPFPDTLEVCAEAGVTAMIQTGGSLRDDDSVAVCDAHGMAMVATGVRHFRH
jgi:hypothetical protein